MFSRIKKMLAVLSVFVLACVVMTQNACADIVSYDEATNAVSFTPGELVTPIITAIVAAVTAASAIWVIVIGIKWLRRFMRG